MKKHVYSEVGGHPVNEDAAIFQSHRDDVSLLIGALADGQGGQAGGAQAAQRAVATCMEQASACAPRLLARPSTWVEICESADQVVSANAEAGYTTLIAVGVSNSFVVGASCGDSAVCLLSNGRFSILTDRQHKNPPVGSGFARLTAFSALPEEPWKLLVVSDGAWKGVGWERIADLLRSLSGEELIGKLREEVLGATSGVLYDDFTAVIIES